MYLCIYASFIYVALNYGSEITEIMFHNYIILWWEKLVSNPVQQGYSDCRLHHKDVALTPGLDPWGNSCNTLTTVKDIKWRRKQIK